MTALIKHLKALPKTVLYGLLTSILFSSTLDATLIGHWPMDELSGSTALDTSGSGNNGINTGGGLNWETGVIGGAARLDGATAAGHSFEVSSISQMSGATALTISCWLKPDFNTSYKGVIMTRDVTDTVGSGRNWGLGREANARIDGRVTNAFIDSTNGSSPDGQWIHAVIVWDGVAKTRRLYINGAADPASATTTNTPTSITSSGAWYFGWDPSATNRHFPGVIDDVAMWDTALSASDVATIYQGGLDGLNAPSALAGDPPPISRDYYVSPSGDNTNDGTIGSPFLTVAKAMQLARAGDTVHLRAGTYREKISAGRSGESGSPITIKAYNGETVIVSTADLVTGWTLQSGDINGDGSSDSDIWAATVNWDAGTDGVGNTLFVDGDFKIEAREGAENDPMEFSNWGQIPHGQLSLTGFTASDLSGWGNDFWNGSKVRHHTFDWVVHDSIVGDYQSSNGQVTFATPLTATSQKHTIGYYIYDTIKALNLAGEWYKDRNTDTLYYKASPSQNPNSLEMEFKTRDFCFDVRGADYITIEGIICRGGSIENDNDTDFNIWKGNTIYGYDMGGYGRAYINGTNNVYRDNEVSQTWGSVVSVTGEGHQMINNYMHDIGYHGVRRVITMSGSGHLVSHNTVSKFARSFLDGFPRSSEFAYNLFEDGGNLSWDTGVFDGDAGRGNGDGCIVHHNVFRDINPIGIYMAFYSGTELTIHHNIVYDFIGTTTMRTGFLSFKKYYHNTFIGTAPLHGGSTSPVVSSSYHNNLQLTVDNVAYAGLKTQGNHNYTPTDFINFAGDDFRLAAGSDAIDRGIVLPGINDGFSGSAPDAGAIEFGEAMFDVGHNFSTPPNPSYAWFPVSGTNILQNGQFNAFPDNWTLINTPVWFYGNAWNGGGLARRGNRCMLLEPGDGMTRTFSNLTPDTWYSIGTGIRLIDDLIDAQSFDASLTSPINTGSHRTENYIDGLSDGDWVRYDNIDFGFSGKYNSLEFLYALPPLNPIGSDSAEFEARLGSPTGPLLGTFELNIVTTDTWFTSSIQIPATVGSQTVYLVARGTVCSDVRVANVRLFSDNIPPQYQVRLTTSNYGGPDQISHAGEADWKNTYETVSFKTGPSDTEVTVTLLNSGAYDAHFDSFALFEDAEVGTDISETGTASQSSTLDQNTADLAINSAGTVDAAITQGNPASWWQLDLGQPSSFHTIRLSPPTSGSGELDLFRVSLWNTDPSQGGSPVWENEYASNASPQQGETLAVSKFDHGLDGITQLQDVLARFVRVQHLGSNNLGLSDVEVFTSDLTDLASSDAEIFTSSSNWQASFSHFINPGEIIITNVDAAHYLELSNFTLSIWDRAPSDGGVIVWQKTYFPTGSVSQGGTFIIRGDEIGSDGTTRLSSVIGRFIQLANAGTNAAGNSLLSLDDVVIHSGSEVYPTSNVALLGDATQSSDHYSTWGMAEDATNSIILPKQDFTTTKNSSNPWWEVDLKQDYDLDQIVLFNREDAAERIGNFRVSVLNSSRTEIWGQNYSYSSGHIPAGGSLTINNNVSNARYVRVQINGSNFLSLVEVQVWIDSSTVRLDPSGTAFSFDLGTSTSPLQSGWTRISPATNGDVWWQNPVQAIDRGPIVGVNDINRDLVFDDGSACLNIKVQDGLWNVTANMGDNDSPHDDIMVWIDDQLITDDFDAPQMQYDYLDYLGGSAGPASFNVVVSGGEFNMHLDDLGGTDPNWVLNRLSLSKLSDNTDSDGDGVTDIFEHTHYGHVTSNTDGTGDIDGDGSTDGAEAIAGTDATDKDSTFLLLANSSSSSENGPDNDVTLTWSSVPGRTYSVWRNTTVEPISSGNWIQEASGIPASGGATTSHSFQVTGGNYFFRIGVEAP